MNDIPILVLSREDVSLFQNLDSPQAQRPCLILYSGGRSGQRFDLEPGSSVIGRDADAAICIDSAGLGRRHTLLRVDDGQVTLRDLGSINGSHVNDVAATQEQVLREGDLIRLGNVVLKFYGRGSVDAVVHDRIYRMATLDAETGACTLRHFQDVLKQAMQQARHDQQPLALMLIELDQFRAVNDEHGHQAGDLILRDSMRLVRSCLRSGDQVGRLGGVEFALCLPHTGAGAATAIAQRIQQSVGRHAFMLSLPDEASRCPILLRQTVSIGLAMLEDGIADVNQFLLLANCQRQQPMPIGEARITA